MSECALRYPASVLVGKPRISVDDLVLLRRHMFPRGLTSADDARQLLVLHRSAAKKCAEWDNWFVETMTAFIVVHSYPQYSLDDLNADWLIAAISQKGFAVTSAELEVVLHAMELASAVPDQLSAFALDQLCIALKSKTGAYADRRGAKRVGIAAEDIDFIYRILRGSLFFGKMMLSRCEVAVLDRIDAIVCDAVNHPAWHDLRRSIRVRTAEGHASAGPWLTMMVDDISLDEAA
jgi:hypothetical protein